MLSALGITGIFSFFEFLKTAVFAVRIYSRRKLISRATITERKKKIIWNRWQKVILMQEIF